jgi:hypothetical protein
VSQTEDMISASLSTFAGKGMAGSVVKQRRIDCSPPELAVWNGEKYKLAFLRSGDTEWLELRAITPGLGTVPMGQCRDPAQFRQYVADFAMKEG